MQIIFKGKKCIKTITNHYKDNPYAFEALAVELIKKMDPHFTDYSLTRPWRDGGRDAIGYYEIGPLDSEFNNLLKIECALEAKCYSEKSVGVRDISRLISRLKYRQFGILVTTSYVATQAYKEVVEDGHPILIITSIDIVNILKRNAIDSRNISKWLETINDER